MRLSDKWQDYCLIDTSDGERLERWGDVTLIRPDPQIIWKCSGEAPEWRTAHAKYNRSSSGGGSWDYRRKLPESWQIKYGELTFMVKPTGFKHTGLFPEQAVNWDFCMNAIRGADRPINVLNLFAYTGGATLACAAAGASVCHVDAVKGMVDWARTNAKLSGLSDKPIRWIVDDAQKFISREIRRVRGRARTRADIQHCPELTAPWETLQSQLQRTAHSPERRGHSHCGIRQYVPPGADQPLSAAVVPAVARGYSLRRLCELVSIFFR